MHTLNDARPLFRIRSDSGEPVYLQLVRQVKHAMASGALRQGDQMPTIRALAAQLVVNPNTVARAYRDLEQEGLLQGGVGRGTFVKVSPPGLLLEERRRRLQPLLDSLVSEGKLLGFDAREVLALVQKAWPND